MRKKFREKNRKKIGTAWVQVINATLNFGIIYQKKGIELSDQNKKWLNCLSHCNELRYPNPESKLEVDLNQ